MFIHERRAMRLCLLCSCERQEKLKPPPRLEGSGESREEEQQAGQAIAQWEQGKADVEEFIATQELVSEFVHAHTCVLTE